MRIRRVSRAAGVLVGLSLVALSLSGCFAFGPPPVVAKYVSEGLVPGAESRSAVVSQQLGRGDASGPALSVPQTATVITGGSIQQELVADAPFAAVRIAIEELDIDSIRNENITWPTGEAPSGTYTVRVDLWDSCGFERTDYVVTVIVGGQPPQTYTGRITGPGDEGSLGSGELVTTFEVG